MGILVPALILLLVHLSSEGMILASEKRLSDMRSNDLKKECSILTSKVLATNELASYEEVMEQTYEEDYQKEYTDENQMVIISAKNETNPLQNSFQNFAEEAAANLSGRVVVVNSHYQIVSDSARLNLGNYLVSAETVELMAEQKSLNTMIDDDTMQYMTSIYDPTSQSIIGIIIATTSVERSSQILDFLKNQKWTMFGIELIMSIFLGSLFIFGNSRGFHHLQKEIDNIIHGYNKSNRLPEDGSREFYRLSVRINRLINKYQEMENSRQEFVANVSHELKTPITSMKILADSLVSMEDVPIELYEEFMQDIVHEIDRENQIITDLLALVRMDKASSGLSVAQTNINELLSMIMKRIVPIAEKRSISMKLTTMRQVVAEVDEVKLTLACNNLIENAVKYNNDGGQVDVSLNADHKFFYIRVKDTGVGIPEECQEQIFERFYRVDKARSRDTGGTGLGLAIARNVILLHKGSIRVHSKLGEGTTFTVRIPLNYIG